MSTPKTPPTPARVPAGTNTGFTESLRRPVAGGVVTSKFGVPRPGHTHKGVDIGVPIGTPVVSAASGTVVHAGPQGAYGNLVVVRHDDNTETKYGHLSRIDVSVGQAVVGGEIIARSGNTGRSSGPHLHYEVVKNGVQVNPLSGASIDPTARSTSTAQQRLDNEEISRQTVLNYKQDEIIQQLISGSHFKDNAANDFDNLTYHWRFFMTGDQEVIDANTTTSGGDLATFYSKLASFEQVTIAESGVTTFSIDEVTMEVTCGTDFQTESTKFTSIEMKVTEPNGVNFLDSLRNAGLKLGVRNYQKCFYYLELTFKGYDEDGNINLKPFDGSIPNGGHWIFTVKINDIDVGLSAGGGSYTLKMIPLTDSLLTGTYNLIPSTVHPSGSTVGEFMDDLCNRLNIVWAKIKGDFGIVKYNTKFHPVADLLSADEVRAMSVSPNEQELNPVQGFDFTSQTNTATIAQGFTISRTLDALMTACEQAQKLAVDALLTGDQVVNTVNPPSANAYRQSILWRVEPEVHTPDYDPLFNEYFHHITLHIYGFRNHAAVLSPQDTLTSDAAQKAILADMAKRNFLPKKYEYLFTGTNSEVIDMDLNFNLSWQALLPSLASNTQEQAASQARVDPNAAPRANVIDQRQQREVANAQTAQTVASDQGSLVKNAQSLYEDLEKARQADKNSTPETKAALDEALKKYRVAAAALEAQGKISHEKRAELRAGRAASLPQTNFGRTFGEDLNESQSVYNLGESRENEAFPITVQVYTPTSPETVGLPGQFHNGKSIYGAVLNQVYGPLATQFFRVSVTIKGDPFWIGAGSFEEAILRSTDIFDGTIPNFQQGVNCFLFKMRYPLGQDDDGNVILNTNETVTGVYQVNKITHRFVDGKFTQVLQATRVPIINLYKSLYNSLYPNPDQQAGDQPTPGSN